MTPKEKAIRIVAEFTSKWYGNSVETNIYIIENIPIYGSFDQFFTAKECALISVEEVINELDDNYDTLHSLERKGYWKEVKQEIENL